MRPIKQVIESLQEEVEPGGRVDRNDHGRAANPFDFKRLEELTTEHLDQENADRLREAVAAAQAWIQDFQDGRNQGQSFVLTGGYGIGKTTILHNLRSAAVVRFTVGPEDDPDFIHEAPLGKFYTATQIMGVLDPGRRDWSPGMGDMGRGPLAEVLARTKVILIDDLGTEEIPYTRAEEVETVRQNRYRELLDYCLGNRKHKIPVLVSSNIPLLVPSGEDWDVNPDFSRILGGAAWSRLYDFAQGSMFDLTGLPDYRLTRPRAAAIRGRN